MNFNAEIEIDLQKLKYNVSTLKDTYDDYSYMFANLKNNAYGMGYKIIETLVNNGVNYILVSTLSEALEVRKLNADIPILVQSVVAADFVYDAILSNITITISDLDTLKNIASLKLKDNLKIHLFIDNGCNKIGLSSKKEVDEAIKIIEEMPKLQLEGVYTELMTYGVLDEDFYHAFNQFLRVIESVGEGVLIHLNEPIMYHKKNALVNGIRFDLSLLGIEENIDDGFISNRKIKAIEKKYDDLSFPDIDLLLIFTIKAKVISLSKALKNSLVGKCFRVREDMCLAIVPIGHKDGITRAIGSVVVNKEICPVIADDIDYLIIGVSPEVKIGDTVYVLNEDRDIYSLIGSLRTNRFYLMSILNNTLLRNYINKDESGDVL